MTDTRIHAPTLLMGCFKNDQIAFASDEAFSVGGNHV